VAPFVAGKNKIINGDFGVWQRGTSTVIGAGSSLYVSDRWRMEGGTVNTTVSQQAFPIGQTDVPGNPTYFLRTTPAGTGSGGTQLISQWIENAATFAGQQITFSFFAKVSSGTQTLDAQYVQRFGTGGSSPVANSIGNFTMTTSWQKFTFTTGLPSVSGKTITSDSALQMRLQATPAAVNYDFANFQLEAGSVATPFQTASGSIGGELALCQRYYWRYTAATANGSYMPFGMGHAVDANNARFMFQYPVSARGNPTLTFTAASTFQKSYGTSFTSIATAENGRNSASVDVVKIGEFAANQAVLVSAAGNQTAYIEMSAEL
jgi:hypothetical protein